MVTEIIILYIVLIVGFLYLTFADLSGMQTAWLDFSGGLQFRMADWLKFATVVLAFRTAVMFRKDAFCKFDGMVLCLALLAKVVSDVFLTLKGTEYLSQIIGIGAYSVVMILFFLRYNYGKFKNLLILPLFFIVPAFLFYFSRGEESLLYFIYVGTQRGLIVTASFYIQVLVAVIVSMAAAVRRGRYARRNTALLTASMFLFILGDICVVLANFAAFEMQEFRNLIWVFYTPSLFFISFSAYDFKKQILT